MRHYIVAANWKMNGSSQFATDMVSQLTAAQLPCQAFIFAPFVYLPQLSQQLTSSNVQVGAQNLSQYDKGAFTGEISAAMLKDINCQAVLVGHSERRQLFHESDDIVAQKFAAVLAAGLTPVLCIGETQAERENEQTEAVVARQLDAVIALCGIEAFAKAIVAYEPVWAIGTGLTATPQQAQAVHRFIREKLAKLNENLASELRLLYGGSVKPANAAQLFAMPDIDGALVGGASLVADDFIAICKATEND